MTRPAACETLNDAQRAALDCGRDLLVDAGAGAGKTQVLGLRYLALLEEGLARVPEIVAFTFTEKAAAEMRARVRQLLDARIGQLGREPGPRLERLLRARGEFHRNGISTIHSFCHRVLRRHAWEAGLEPGAPLIDEREQHRVRREAVNAVLHRAPPEGEAALREALEHFGSLATLAQLGAAITEMLGRRHAATPALEAACKAWADPDAEIARRRKAAEDEADLALAPAIAEIARLPFAATASVHPDDKLRAEFDAVAAALKLRGGARHRALREVLLTANGEARSISVGNAGYWKGVTPGLKAARAALSAASRTLAACGEVFELDEAHDRLVGRTVGHLKTVFDAVLRAFEAECAGRLDFLELELRTLRLLRGSDSADAVIAGVRYLLIDEFQDTNPTQAAIFEALLARHHHPGRLFAVGDAKQSIYGFRGADVGVFNDAREQIPARNGALAKQAQTLPWSLTCQDMAARRAGVVTLDTNYRSQPSLLEAGNALFERMLAGTRRFDAPAKPLRAGVADDGDRHPRLVLHCLKARKRDDEDRRDSEEAELAARQALELRGQGFAWRDIAVLVRRNTRNAGYRAAFARHGVPLLLHDQGGLLDTQEALDSLNLLRVVVDPGDDIAAVGVLRSAFCGLTDRALTEIALADESRRPLLERVLAAKPSSSDDMRALDHFTALLAELREHADREPPAAVLARAYALCGYGLAVGCGAQAEQRLANLERLLEVVGRIEPPVLAAVCRELRERREAGEDEQQASPDADGVRLLTIHKSKGMEFEAVIVPDLGNDRKPADTGMLRALPEAGEPAGLYLRLQQGDELGRWRPDLAAWRAARLKREREDAEDKRVFYTAFTRAKRRLVLIGEVKADKDGGLAAARVSWAAQVLGALGVSRWGEPHPLIRWHEALDPLETPSHQPEIARLTGALARGEMTVRAPIDTRLAAPLAAATRAPVADPRAVEVGVQVHGAIEQYLRRRACSGEFETGVIPRDLPTDVRAHVAAAREALAMRPRARREFCEWRVFGHRDGRVIERRMDLLRELEGDEFEIVDFKSDALGAGASPQAAAAQYREQLSEYRDLLEAALNTRGRKPRAIRTYVCFTAPALEAAARIVEV